MAGQLAELARHRAFARRSLVLVFEGMDAAGEGRRHPALDRRAGSAPVPVVPVAAPTEDERAHPYLWRFWRQLPRWGHVTWVVVPANDKNFACVMIVRRVVKHLERALRL